MSLKVFTNPFPLWPLSEDIACLKLFNVLQPCLTFWASVWWSDQETFPVLLHAFLSKISCLKCFQGIQYNLYADDTQLHLSIPEFSPAIYFCKHNMFKTELSSFHPSPPPADTTTRHTDEEVQSLGLALTLLSFIPHIQSATKSGCFFLCNIIKIHHFPYVPSAKTLAQTWTTPIFPSVFCWLTPAPSPGSTLKLSMASLHSCP